MGGSAVLQEYFGDEDLGLTSGSHIDIIKRALIASVVSAVRRYRVNPIAYTDILACLDVKHT